jgi:hypothetical protein
MKSLWFRPHWRNGLTHGFALLLATVSTIYINHQFNQELSACKAVSSIQNPEAKKATEKRCNKVFENLDKDLDPWIYIFLGFNTYLLMYSWASGNISVITAMETKPNQNEFKVKRPPSDNEELYLFGFHFAKVLKSETQLVINPELVFFEEFFNYKYTGFLKRDLLFSAILTSYPYLELKTQDSLRASLISLTTNPNDSFHVSEVSFYFFSLAKKLGLSPTDKCLKLIALSKALTTIRSPEIDSLDTLLIPNSINPSDFSTPLWIKIFEDWTIIAQIAKSEIDVKQIYDIVNPPSISTNAQAQDVFDTLFTK